MKILFVFLGIILVTFGKAQIYESFYLDGFSIDGEIFPIPQNEELPFAITEFGNDWGDYYYKQTTICGMRKFEIEYIDFYHIRILGIAEMQNVNCNQSENQTFQTNYFNLFHNGAVFNIAYIDFEDGGAIELSRWDENDQYITVNYVTDLPSNNLYQPIQNLSWDHIYDSPNNYFTLSWTEPEQPHAELIGYNIYRENDLYRFQTETSLYNQIWGSNCEEDFLLYPQDNPKPFYAHVTAVYEGGIESGFNQTVLVNGVAVGTQDMDEKTISIFPNPTTNFLQFSQKLKEIKVYDLSGRLVQIQINSVEKLDVSHLSQGTYILIGSSHSGNNIRWKFVKK